MKYKLCSFSILLGLVLWGQTIYGQPQANTSVDIIIEKIRGLENVKDPKCHATANRLEDFMYGTPLTMAARNLKIDILKEISLYIREKGSKIARAVNQDSLGSRQITQIVDSISLVGRYKNGDYFLKVDTGVIRIAQLDFNQYSSVAYSYRAMLSVEQDMFFFSPVNLLPLTGRAVESLNRYLNLVTLAALQIADKKARLEQQKEISRKVLQDAWIEVLQGPNSAGLFGFQYPELTPISNGGDQNILRQIIRQKIESYQQYNQLNSNVFLRNIQVFFAKQKWPVDSIASRELQNYYLESMVAFCSELLKLSSQISKERKGALVRIQDVQQALHQFTPHNVNYLEDVIFFPNDTENKITIEAYDLDAYRDGGIHWRILEYALNDESTAIPEIDPNAAEVVVEGVAQMGVLVLRLAGTYSHDQNHPHLKVDDIEKAFIKIQNLIYKYPSLPSISSNSNQVFSSGAGTAKSEGQNAGFVDVTSGVGIQFEHRSSDWLSRLIRSYVYSDAENTAKLAIPPAFGGAGVAAEDINNDGLTDILLLGGRGNKLYLNEGQGKFVDITDFSPINVWNPDQKSLGEPRQPIIVDFDNDGFQDILITYVNGFHRVYRNLGGGRFEDVSHISKLDGTNQVAGPATVLDYDNDGWLDVFIGYFGNYLQGTLPTLSRDNQNGMPNKLYKNLGGFTFEEVLFTQDTLSDRGWTQAVGHTDINQDGLQDIIVGNDFGINHYYLNTKNQGFVDKGKDWGVDKPSYTMNVGIGDLNRDQYPDLYISNIVVMQKEEKYVSPNEQTIMKFDPEKMPAIRTIEANDLFLSNVRKKEFSDFSQSDAVGRGFSSTGWSWDADFFDFDNDGDEDLYCLNGMNDFQVYSSENPYYYGEKDEGNRVEYAQSNREKNVFFVNDGGVLINKAEELGADLYTNSRSASYLDYDADGDLDIIINNYHDRAIFLENQSGNHNNWLQIKLVGDPSKGVSRDAIGATILLNSENHKNIWREVHSTTGYLSVHPKMQHFGLGTDTKADITIKWPNGKVTNINMLDANKNYTINYPDVLKTN